MKYLSLFSGIEAASIAWQPLGFEPVAFAEIEKFPCAVLAQRHPGVPNLGDVIQITQQQIEQLGHIDIVIFGSPCQDFSIAGKRKGLKHADGSNTRSGLFFDAVKIADWSKARWVVMENVPGMFSQHEGRDFATVVGELAGTELDVPADGWRNTGVALGPKGLVEWCVLDAQWRGLAQRRKRVFLVRDSGNWSDRPPLLFERESLFGNPPTRRTAGEGIAAGVANSLGGSSQSGGFRTTDLDNQGAFIPSGPTCPLTHNPYGDHESRESLLIPTLTHALSADGFDASEDGTGRGTPLVPIVMAHGQGNAEVVSDGSPSLTCNHEAPILAFNWQSGGSKARLSARETHIDALSSNQTPAVAIGFQPRIARNGRGDMGDKVNALQAQSGQTGKGNAAPCVAFQPRYFTRDNKTGGVESCGEQVPALSADHGGGDSAPHVAQGYQVRRLTPRECERLQGFPDDHTLIPITKTKMSADGPRYKAIGNSFATPCVRWIGERILSVTKIGLAK